ncbi:acyl-CoA carboxylase epsilon subunit [Cellulomonas alba]|uniref:Acyl-CoA carboxylase epsilon subunit n=1 Tax=Cellulomonas alba TaxID=3053467 RepID=A0ABT7SHR0_9CELL|nr:acyl-CoA carboxylase epsilon subunit [Cellulomonas alba]MDM7855725.1 acyl-CoA carboxylase epsilon subunit [Cellulomonas alba]
MSDPAHVQVVRGEPDDVELAALVAGLVAASSAAGDEWVERPAERSAWVARRHGVRPAGWRTGPDAWRWSLRG